MLLCTTYLGRWNGVSVNLGDTERRQAGARATNDSPQQFTRRAIRYVVLSPTLDFSAHHHHRHMVLVFAAARGIMRLTRNMQGERTPPRDNARLEFYESFRAAKGHFPLAFSFAGESRAVCHKSCRTPCRPWGIYARAIYTRGR